MLAIVQHGGKVSVMPADCVYNMAECELLWMW